MKKIEKLEYINIGSTQWELNNMLEKYKPEVMAKVLDKMVEIIDVLNQKQPEVDTVEAFREMEEIEDMTPEEFNKSKYAKPEKQEEWRGFDKLIKETGKKWCSGEWDIPYEEYLAKETWERVSQLLSERTFTKEELHTMINIIDTIEGEYSDEFLEDVDKLREKTSSLLKEEE